MSVRSYKRRIRMYYDDEPSGETLDALRLRFTHKACPNCRIPIYGTEGDIDEKIANHVWLSGCDKDREVGKDVD